MYEINKTERLRNLLKDWDPMGFIADGAPEDEYDVEADEISNRYKKDSTPGEAGELAYAIFKEYMEVDAPSVKEDCLKRGHEIKAILDGDT
jgi:hypothetical protein